MNNIISIATVLLLMGPLQEQESKPSFSEKSPTAEQLTIQLQPSGRALAPVPPKFTARITADDLAVLLEGRELPFPLRLERQREAMRQAVQKINFSALLDHLADFLAQEFAGRFDPQSDLIRVPVPENRRVEIDASDIQEEPFRGPTHEVVGFLIHGVSEAEFSRVGVRIMQAARKLIDSGDPIYDRTTSEYIHWLAQGELEEIRAQIREQEITTREKEEIRHRYANALNIDPDEDPTGATGDWLKESRRFSYIIQEGEFIQRLKPLVEQINREIEIAGFSPPTPLDKPGIYYDPEIGDVDVVLPKGMLSEFLELADQYERRMAEDAIISIEAVRLTDRDIVSGALASRSRGQIQGVHDPRRGISRRGVLREVGINSLLAVANQELQARTLSGIAAGEVPEGTTPIVIAPPTLPPIQVGKEVTTIGMTFSAGADDLFFDGRQQVTGFSYLGPDGLAHTLTIEVVDSLREFWDSIERNLIVHKIKKTDTLTEFTVPVGPNTKTYKGIAALISQENQQLIVATGTGAISEIEATAGTWLVIEDFAITPIPGSSTTLTEDEKQEIRDKVLLTMFLRDPYMDRDQKQGLLGITSRQELSRSIDELYRDLSDQPIRSGRSARTYGTIFDERYSKTLGDERFEKKERNSTITLTFYSSQGNIIQQAQTQLGDANDLTSFTTLLRPNTVTPISSFFTRSGSGATGTSPLTGADKGERVDKEKTMTHLVIRARFPTVGREDADRAEGRFMGYFELPISRKPTTSVDVPFLSSSEHPVERLAKFRVGLMFPVLDPDRVAKTLSRFKPNRFPGDVPPEVYESAKSRMLMNRKIIGDAMAPAMRMPAEFLERFVLEVRSLLEYDEDFFNAPNFALRNMSQWNDPDRIVLALNNSPGRFALDRLVMLLDDLGAHLLPEDYAEDFLAFAPPSGWSPRRIYPLSAEQLRNLRRDVAIHYLRFQEAYGDAFLEAASNVFDLGTYRSRDEDVLMSGPFHGYHDLVIFDNSGRHKSDPQLYAAAHEQFLFLKRGGYKGKLFEPSLLSLKHLRDEYRRVIYRGPDVLALAEEMDGSGY